MLNEYPSYEECENLKADGWKIYSNSTTPLEKAKILLQYIIPAHYWRARKSIEARKDRRSFLRKIVGKKYHPGYELDIDHYIQNWIYSHRNRFDKQIIDILIEYYDAVSSPYMKDEHTEYHEWAV